MSRGKRREPDTWPLSDWAVALWFIVVLALGVGTAFAIGIPRGWPEWIVIALGVALTLVFRQLFWTVLRRVQRRDGR